MKLENEKLSIQLTTALSQHKESSALLASQSSTMDHLQKDLDAAVQEISRLNLVSEHFKDLATTTSSSSSSNTSNNNSSGANLYSEKQQKEMEEEINALTSELGLLRRDNEGLLEKCKERALKPYVKNVFKPSLSSCSLCSTPNSNP